MADLHLSSARAIDDAALNAICHHAGPPTEPHLVAAIFRDAGFRQAIIDAVDHDWGPVRVRTVFVHQRPRVSFVCDGGSHFVCELGDALVVYRERLRIGQARTQALLFQAKRWTVKSGIG